MSDTIGHAGSTRADVNRDAERLIRQMASNAANAPPHAVAGVSWNRYVRRWQAVYRAEAEDPDDTRPRRMRHVGYYSDWSDADAALSKYSESVAASRRRLSSAFAGDEDRGSAVGDHRIATDCDE